MAFESGIVLGPVLLRPEITTSHAPIELLATESIITDVMWEDSIHTAIFEHLRVF